MKRASYLRTDAWLLRGIGSLPGALRLAAGRLSFTASGPGNLGARRLRALEREAGREGLAEWLGEGQRAVVFDVPLSDVEAVRFPWYYVSGGVQLTVKGVRYRFGFDRPANTRRSDEGGDLIGALSAARRSGRAWKAALLG